MAEDRDLIKKIWETNRALQDHDGVIKPLAALEKLSDTFGCI